MRLRCLGRRVCFPYPLGIAVDATFYVFYTYDTDVFLRDVHIEDTDVNRFLVTTNSTVDLRGITLVGNRMDPFYLYDVAGVMEDVRVEGNTFTRAENYLTGASAGDLVVRDFVLTNNLLSLDYGLTLFEPRVFYVRNASFDHVQIVGNTLVEVESYSGGVPHYSTMRAFDLSSNTVVQHLTYVGNLATAGFYCWQPAELRHAAIVGNQGDAVAAAGACELDHSIVAYNTGFGVANSPRVVYSDVYGNDGGDFVAMVNPVGVFGNQAVEPGLQTWGPTLPPAYVDVHLRPDSLLRDAGDPAELDVDGTVADLGAYGGVGGEDDLVDSDLDGMPDGWELRQGLDPAVDDALDDPDGDELDNLGEFVKGTLPHNADTDADGVDDRFDDFPFDASDA